MYLYKTRVEALEPGHDVRQATMDVIGASWYALATNDNTRKAMLSKPATLEVATRIWLEEDDKSSPSKSLPPGTSLLNSLLKTATYDTLDQVLKISGKKADAVAKLALTRLRNAMKSKAPNGGYVTMYIDFLNMISRSPKHPFRHALLGANVVWTVTSNLCKIGTILNDTGDLAFVDAMVAGFGYLFNCLESTDGFTWVNQALGTGLLQAFCDCSTKFDLIHPEDLQMVMGVFKDILPRYMVYRSVIDHFVTGMRKAEQEPYRKRITSSIAKDAWHELRMLTDERRIVGVQADVVKTSHLTCDNVKVRQMPC